MIKKLKSVITAVSISPTIIEVAGDDWSVMPKRLLT
jgi:hypothetical protein